MMTATTAHREWATRPADERFTSVHALYDAARTGRASTEERRIDAVHFGTDRVRWPMRVVHTATAATPSVAIQLHT